MDKSKIEEIVKGLVKEMAKAGTAEDAAEDTGIPKRSIQVGKVTFSKDGDTKYTVTDIDSETGKVSWTVERLPSFEELFSTATDLVSVAKGVRNETKGDNFFREIFETSKLLRNKIRTHLRNEYPDEYNRIVMRLSENELPSVSDISDLQDRRVDAVAKAISEKYDIKDDGMLRGTIRMALADHLFEDEVEEISTSGAAGAYLTPYAFRLKGSKPNDKAYKELGYKEVKENESPSLNAKIYAEDMMRQYRKMYRIVDGNFGSEAADEFKNIVKSKMSQLQEGVGADLGPGPKASEDGVKDNSYVKQFGYKLVPKKIKGSGIIVKQLFEDNSVESFQQGRVLAFDRIEQEMNDIYKMLSNAKNETSDYYKENPGSYSVVKPTDLVLDYIKDIKDLLKGE
ncbi:MAG: hypothetical protein CMD25_01165 [Flavobacteriales bacterium]|nr:hypothetical protein [Flavobacteriales bacterium]|tara:strand:- start:39 stop:1232 length:1194 start_codon:yes stop_codon:yes gene_type:complete